MATYVEIAAYGWRFQPRVAAVIDWRDHVLLQGALDGPFWVLPGGRLLPLETTAAALARTLRWELGQDVSVRRLLWVMELVTTIGGQPFHELGLYHLVDLPDGSPLFDLTRDHAGVERGHDLVLRWFPIASLPDTPLQPDFLRTALGRLPDGPRHIVRTDIDPR